MRASVSCVCVVLVVICLFIPWTFRICFLHAETNISSFVHLIQETKTEKNEGEEEEGNEEVENFISLSAQPNSRWWPTQFLPAFFLCLFVLVKWIRSAEPTRLLKHYDMNSMINMPAFVICTENGRLNAYNNNNDEEIGIITMNIWCFAYRTILDEWGWSWLWSLSYHV